MSNFPTEHVFAYTDPYVSNSDDDAARWKILFVYSTKSAIGRPHHQNVCTLCFIEDDTGNLPHS